MAGELHHAWREERHLPLHLLEASYQDLTEVMPLPTDGTLRLVMLTNLE